MPEPINNPIDFNRVEAVRLHLKLRQADMATLFGVTRVTYIRWTKGQQVRTNAQKFVRARLRALLGTIRDGMVQPELMALKPEERFRRLLTKME